MITEREATRYGISKDLFKYESKVEGIDRVYEIEGSVEASIPRGFIYEKGKVVLLTDRELLGELDLSVYQKDKKIDPSSLDLLKKIIPGILLYMRITV